MQAASQITRGAIETIFKSGNADQHPVIQVIDLKRISHNGQNTSTPPRYRLVISDGTHFQQAMIATQLNNLITEGTLLPNTLIRLNEVICNTVQEKRIVIILNLQIVAHLPSKVGNPSSIDAVMSGSDSANGQPPQDVKPAQPFGNQNVPPPHAGKTEGVRSNGFGSGNVPFGQIPPSSKGMARPGFGGQTSLSEGNNGWNASSGVMNNPNPFSNRSVSGAIQKMDSTPTGFFRPIQSINPYQNGWTIRGRCTFKSDLRKFQNARGEGQVISFELTDDSGSIRITGFTNIAQRILDTVHINRIYKVSRGFLKQANERYNRSTSSFEMTIDLNSLLEEIQDDGTFMQIKYNFVKIANLESVAVKGNCDVLGVVTGVGQLSEIIIRSSGEPCARRNITLTDDSNASVDLTLWRKQAETFLTEDAVQRHPVLLIRNAIRGDFGGVSLNVTRMSTLELDPVNVAEANKLRAWFDGGGLDLSNVQSVTAGPGSAGGGKITGPRKSLLQAKVEDVDPAFSQGNGSDATATFVTRAMVSFVNTKSDMYYPGDPETKKKVVDQGNGTWMSESTGRQLNDSEVVWRYVVSMKVADHSSSHWVSAFDEVGTVLFGRTAKEMKDLKDGDISLMESVVEDALCRPILLKVQVKERMWRDANQIRYTVSRAEVIDFAAESRMLLQEIASYGAA